MQVGAGGSGGANYSTDGSDGQASFIKRSTVLLRKVRAVQKRRRMELHFNQIHTVLEG